MARQLILAKLREVSLSHSRPSLPETINALAESMRESGLINPIIVKAATVFDGAVMTQGYKVVAGNHRVSSARALGWTEIEAFVVDGDDELASELIEIDENLCRAELTAAQRSVAVKRRAEIWKALHPSEIAVEQDIPPQSKSAMARPQVKGFAAETADVSGMTKQSINRHLARAEALGDDLAEVTGTSLDKGVELDALARMDAPERHALIERAKAGEQVTARGRDEEEANVRRVKQMLAELERCAKYMDEVEFAAIAADMDVSGTARRLAAVIAKASLRKVA